MLTLKITLKNVRTSWLILLCSLLKKLEIWWKLMSIIDFAFWLDLRQKCRMIQVLFYRSFAVFTWAVFAPASCWSIFTLSLQTWLSSLAFFLILVLLINLLSLGDEMLCMLKCIFLCDNPIRLFLWTYCFFYDFFQRFPSFWVILHLPVLLKLIVVFQIYPLLHKLNALFVLNGLLTICKLLS